MSDLKLLNINQLASISRLNRATVSKRLSNLEPVEEKSKLKLYESDKALRLLLEIKGTDTEKEMGQSDLRVQRARAEKLEIELEVLKGQHVPIEDVCKAIEKEFTYVRSTLLSIPQKRAKALALESDPAVIRTMLEEDVNEALDHLQADQKYTAEETHETNEEVNKPAEK